MQETIEEIEKEKEEDLLKLAKDKDDLKQKLGSSL